jgi:hypothetical protein
MTTERQVLDNPIPFHQKLLDYGERPYWTMDGRRIAFITQSYGDAEEIDFATRQVRPLTRDLGPHHAFLRVLVLHNGDYILIGPREFKDPHTSRGTENELWWLDRSLTRPPQPLGARIFEGIALSWTAPRLSYTVTATQDPRLKDIAEMHVAEIEVTGAGAKLVNDRVVMRTRGGPCPEPQDFRHNDTEVLFAGYSRKTKTAEHSLVGGVEVATGQMRIYVNEPDVYNECEGIFPDQEHICLESAGDGKFPPTDLWKMKLDGSGRRARMTQLCRFPPWRATNSNVSPDGRWLAFMVNKSGDDYGFGRGLGLLDLAAWEKSEFGQAWETPRGLIGVPPDLR